MRETSWLDNLIWVSLFILLVPSGLVVASWNSLPGSRLYNFKIGVENTLVALAPTKQAKGELEVAYTERRFSEATTLLTDTSSAAGMEYFRAQAQEAKEAIQRAPPGEARNKLTEKYVLSLKTASSQLQQHKQVYASNTQRSRRSTATQNTQTTTTNTQVIIQRQIIIVNNVAQTATPTLTPTPTPVIEEEDNDDIITIIDDTTDEIDVIVEELERSSASTTSSPSIDSSDVEESGASSSQFDRQTQGTGGIHRDNFPNTNNWDIENIRVE